MISTTPMNTPNATSKPFPESQHTAAFLPVAVAVVLVEDGEEVDGAAPALLDGGVVVTIIAVDVLATVLLVAVDGVALEELEPECEDSALKAVVECGTKVDCEVVFVVEIWLGCKEASVLEELPVMPLMTPPTAAGGGPSRRSIAELSALAANCASV